MQDKASNKMFDRTREDVGNVALLEHVNLTVPDQSLAAMFYVTGLGFTRDPYIDFGTFNMWINVGDQQFHLPTNTAQVLRGHIGIMMPDLEGLLSRLKFASKGLQDTQFSYTEQSDHIELSCPWGNQIKVFPATDMMALGMPYVQFDVPAGSIAGIARFYQDVIGCQTQLENDCLSVFMGHNQSLRFVETDRPLPAYDGHHIAIYVANFSGPHQWLSSRDLISEESDQYQYRFERIVDPAGDPEITLFQIEHEVRSLSHAMYRRPLVNRNPSTNFFTYKRGNEQFSPG